MHRCHVDPSSWTNDGIRLSAEEAHYLLDVLRIRQGEQVIVFDGRGREAVAQVAPAGAPAPGAGRRSAPLRSIALAVLAERPPRKPAVALTLLQAVPKGARMDWIVEKATELGASVIVPVISERVVLRLAERQRREKAERWQRIALNAARQCQVGVVPVVREVMDLPAALDLGRKADLFLVGSLQPDARPLREVLRKKRASPPSSISLLIGPEGDLAPEETREAAAAGAIAVSFGSLVLRVETAALYGLSVLAYELGDAGNVGGGELTDVVS